MDNLLREMESSTKSERRIKVIKAAHNAHANEQFLVSIPTLFAQLEGLILDLLAELGYARSHPKDNKWYEVDPDTGEYAKTGKGKPRKVQGLDDLNAILAKVSPNPLPHKSYRSLEDIRVLRNRVMHGSDTDYGKPGLSSRLLMFVRIISQRIRLEEEFKREA